MPRDPRVPHVAVPAHTPATLPATVVPSTTAPTTEPTTELPAWGRLCAAQGEVVGVVEGVEVDVRVDALAVAARWTVRLRNTGTEQLEALYLFPLPAGYAVVGATATFGPHRVAAELAEREAARALFDAAVAAGHRVGLLEADRSEVFTLTLGRLVPGEHPELTIDLVGSLDVDGGIGALRVPLVVAPRYSPVAAPWSGPHAVGTVVDPDASRVTAPRATDPAQHIPAGISVRWHGGLDPATASCSAPGASWTASPDGWQLRWEGIADRDVVVQAPVTAQLHSARSFPRPGGGQVVRIDLVGEAPAAGVAPAAGRDIVVLLDRSGSMAGWKMAAARRLAGRLVDALTGRDRVVVVGFDDALLRSDGALVAADAAARRRIGRFVESIEANGGTELAAAIAEGCRLLHPAPQDEPDRDRVLVVLTDAQVTDEAHTTATLAALLGDAQVYVVGIDEAVNAGLCRGLASVGGGRFELVTQLEALAAAIDKVVARVARPVVRGVHCTGAAGAAVPRVPVDLFDGAVTTLWVPVPGDLPDGMVELVGRTAAGPWHRRVAVVASAEPATQRALWAAAELGALDEAHQSGDELARAAAISLSLAAGVLCRHTAFVAVDHAGRRLAGPVGSVIQPLAQPAGWPGPVLFAASATFAPAPRLARPAPAPRGLSRFKARHQGEASVAAAAPTAALAGAAPGGPPAREEMPDVAVMGAGLRKRLRRVLELAADGPAALAIEALDELLDDLATLAVPASVAEAVRALRRCLLDGAPAERAAALAAVEALLADPAPTP